MRLAPYFVSRQRAAESGVTEARPKRYYYDTHQQLGDHLATFLMAYNFAKRLKTLKGLTPYEYICQQWQQQPERFLFDPSHLTLGLYT